MRSPFAQAFGYIQNLFKRNEAKMREDEHIETEREMRDFMRSKNLINKHNINYWNKSHKKVALRNI